MLNCKSLPALDSEHNLNQNLTTKTFLLEGSNVDLWDPTTVLLRTPLIHPNQLCHPHFELRRRRPSPSERRVVPFPPLVSLAPPLAGKMVTDQTFTTSTLNEDGQTSLVVSLNDGRHAARET